MLPYDSLRQYEIIFTDVKSIGTESGYNAALTETEQLMGADAVINVICPNLCVNITGDENETRISNH